MTENLRWRVEFYLDARDRNPVLDFLNTLPRQERAKLFRVFRLLREYGTALAMPHARPVGNIWELRAGDERVFYFAYTGRRFVLLHAFRKKTQQTPERELQIAERRMADFLGRSK